MKSPLKYIGPDGKYYFSTAQDQYNETNSLGGTSDFYDYDNDNLLDNYPVRPSSSTRDVKARETTDTFSIPGGIGTYNAADSVNKTSIPDQPQGGYRYQDATMSGDMSDPYNSSIMSPASDQFGGGGGFGKRFASNMSSPQAMAGMAKGIGGILQGAIGRGARRDAQIKAQDQYDDMLSEYRALDTSNLYADFENQFTGLENAYEDLTVNRQQAEFEKDMFQQQQATIMQGLKGAAGGSGIAGLAQAMANQGQLQAQKAGGSIGLQESKINMLRAQEASRLQQLERTGATQAEQLRLAGAERARGLDYMQTSTQLGMAQQDLAAKNQAIAQADAALYGGIGTVVGTAATAAISDRRLKKNISLIGRSPSGLNVYNFEYINSKHGEGIFQGVMSDEIPFNAVINNGAYDMVNYDMLDVEFKRIN